MIRRYRRTALSQYILVGLILIALIILGYLFTMAMRSIPFEDHFALPWAAGRAWLLEGVNPYDADLAEIAENAMAEAGFLGQLPEQVVLTHPAITLFLYLPFSLIPFSISRAIWMVILTVLIGMMVYLSIRFTEWSVSTLEEVGVYALLILWYPGIYITLTGHLNLIFIFLALLGLILIKSGRFQAAGFILALTAGLLPLVILVIIFAVLWSIAKRQWSFLVAFFSGITFLMIVSLLMLPGWPLNWLRSVVQTYQDLSWIETPLMTLATILPGIANFISIALHASFGIYLLVIWINIFRKPERVFIWSALAVFVLSFLFDIQYSLFGLYLLIPALCLVIRFSFDRWGLIGKTIAWFILIIISAGSWLLMLPEIKFTGNLSVPVLTVGLPLIIFIGMVWIRWWAVKLTRLPRI